MSLKSNIYYLAPALILALEVQVTRKAQHIFYDFLYGMQHK